MLRKYLISTTKSNDRWIQTKRMITSLIIIGESNKYCLERWIQYVGPTCCSSPTPFFENHTSILISNWLSLQWDRAAVNQSISYSVQGRYAFIATDQKTEKSGKMWQLWQFCMPISSVTYLSSMLILNVLANILVLNKPIDFYGLTAFMDCYMLGLYSTLQNWKRIFFIS